MAVGRHLGIAVAEYDDRILTFVPYYEEMLELTADLIRVLEAPEPIVVELGTGSGALAARVLRRLPSSRVIGIDEDPAMLALAAARLKRSPRAELRQGSFARADLPSCDAVVASIALHHVKTRQQKLALYRRIAGALRSGGLFVNADYAPPASPPLAGRATSAWLGHLLHAYSPREAGRYLRAWAREDVYQPLDVELDLVARAGLDVDVAWRRDGFAVIVGRKRESRVKRSASRARPSARRR